MFLRRSVQFFARRMRSSRTLAVWPVLGFSNRVPFGLRRLPDGSASRAERGLIQVPKLTLFDSTSRDAAVFTDMSLPDCSKAP